MLFIFDWDGTLSDSTDKIIVCMQQAAVNLGLPELTDSAVRDIIGLGLPEAIAKLCPSVSDKDQNSLREQYIHCFVEADQTPSKFFPEVVETLQHLREQGHQLTVATGKSRLGLERVFNNLDMQDFFHGSRCADETASKPHPLMLHELLEEFRSHPQDAVMVGDTEFDMDMAARIEMPRVAVSYGAHHIDRLRRFKPVLCMDNFDQLLSLELG